jgi:predicted secreted protein
METMDLQPFFIEFKYHNKVIIAEVKPCCQQDNVIFYDISINNTYQFTITQNTNSYDDFDWRIALVNADKQVEPDLVEAIGHEIEKHLV